LSSQSAGDLGPPESLMLGRSVSRGNSGNGPRYPAIELSADQPRGRTRDRIYALIGRNDPRTQATGISTLGGISRLAHFLPPSDTTTTITEYGPGMLLRDAEPLREASIYNRLMGKGTWRAMGNSWSISPGGRVRPRNRGSSTARARGASLRLCGANCQRAEIADAFGRSRKSPGGPGWGSARLQLACLADYQLCA